MHEHPGIGSVLQMHTCTKDQTKEMKLLRKKPFVLILGNNEKERYYHIKLEDVRRKLSSRLRWETMWITEDKIPSEKIDTYDKFIKACTEALRE